MLRNDFNLNAKNMFLNKQLTHKIIALVNRNYFQYKSLSYFAIQLVFVL